MADVSKLNWKNSIEGLVITALGLMMLALALSIENNPVSLDIGWVNLFAQAKFTPTIAAAAVLILGILLTVKQLKGTHASAHISKEELKRLAVILPLIAGYLLAVYFSNFTVPTIVYTVAILFYLNVKKNSPWKLALICGIYVFVALIVLPKLIGLRLP